jgi:hypothetical protein
MSALLTYLQAGVPGHSGPFYALVSKRKGHLVTRDAINEMVAHWE